MVAIKGEMQFDDGTQAEQTQTERTPAPLIVMVTGQDGRPIWGKGVTKPWQEVPENSNFNHKWVSGPDHAILYVQQTPPSGWTMKIGPFAQDTRLSIQVIAEGRRVLHVTNVEMKSVAWRDGDFLPLWPLPEGAAP